MVAKEDSQKKERCVISVLKITCTSLELEIALG
jgi:hypothetical protein